MSKELKLGVCSLYINLVPFPEQVSVTVATNFMGTLSITRALIPLLRPHSRVVNVSSTVGALSKSQPNIQVSLS